jgi:hypothetical protein
MTKYVAANSRENSRTSLSTSSPRLASSSRRPLATAASTTSLTLGLVDVGNPLRDFEAATDHGQSTLGAYWVVEARPWAGLSVSTSATRQRPVLGAASCPRDKARPPTTQGLDGAVAGCDAAAQPRTRSVSAPTRYFGIRRLGGLV